MSDPIQVTDAAGRKITARVLDPADILDLLEAAGSASSNGGYVRYATLISSVSEIDGIPVPIPRKKEDIKALARRLGNDGLVALSKALYGDDEAEDAPAASVVETAKN